MVKSSPPIESRVLLQNGRQVNQIVHHQKQPIEQRLIKPMRPQQVQQKQQQANVNQQYK